MNEANKKAPKWGLIIIRTTAEVCLIVDVVGYVASRDSLFIMAGLFSFVGILWSIIREANS
jgi:hypothetical protein